VEHEDNAIQMGKLAGLNMAGTKEASAHVPMFCSDLFDLGYEAVGEISSKMETMTYWQDLLFGERTGAQCGIVEYLGQAGSSPRSDRTVPGD
jgi:hypothetical protein